MATTKEHESDREALTAALEGRAIWNTATLKYNFAMDSDRMAFVSDPSNSENVFTGAHAFNALGVANSSEANIRSDVVSAMAAWSRVANIPMFVETTHYSAADIKIAGVDDYSYAGAMYFPGTNVRGSLDVSPLDYESYLLLNTTADYVSARPELGGGHYGVRLALHELGHGLGIAHPHDDGHGSTKVAERGAAADEPVYDNERYTVMSYEKGGWNQNVARIYGHAVTPMALDVRAIQGMYGAKSSYEGNTTYRLTDARSAALDLDGSDGTVVIGRAFYTIWDTGGTDELIYSGSSRVLLNLNNASISLSHDDRIEALVDLVQRGTVFDALPNEIKNYLTDPEYSAAGNISAIFDSAGNVQLGGYSIASDAHDADAKVEKGTGGSGDDVIVGNEGANVLTGNLGNDFILGSAGDDAIYGGDGDDELGGGEGNDALDGGPGADTALFSDVYSNYDLTRNESTGVVTVSHARGSRADGTDTLANIESARFRDVTVDLTGDEIEAVPVDFIFLVDLSSSFSDDLPNFVNSAPAIFDAVRAIDPNAQFAISSFIDLPVSPYGSAGDYVYRPELALTADLDLFRTALNGLSTRNGGDTREAQWAGLWGAVNGIGLKLRENSRKIVLIATDAPAHSASDYGLDETTIRQFLIENAITTIGGSTASAGVTEDVAIFDAEVRPDVTGAPGTDAVDPTDVGDTDPDYTGDPEDPLLEEVFSEVLGNASVLFAVTSDAEGFYVYEVPGTVASAIAPLSSSGEDIADAVRLALAKVAGEVTETGGDGTDDLLVGTPDNDGLFGLGGNDTIIGRAGDDVIDGGSGDDRLNGGEGDDDLRGGTGNDVIFDSMGDNQIDGGDGDDTIYVFAGTNVVRGGLGDDYISGGFDEDSVHGGAGDDVLKGGGDSDTFVFGPGNGDDVVKDFSGEEDLIDLTEFTDISGLSDVTVTVDGDGTTVSLAAHGGGEVRLEGYVDSLEAKHFLFAKPIMSTDDFSADESTTGAVAVDGSTTGNLETGGDRDWFAVELVAGQTYVVDLEGSETGRGTLADPYLRGIYDAGGNFLSGTSNDDVGKTQLNSRVTFTPTVTGTYYVAVGAFESEVGTYTVSVTEETVSVSEPVGEDLPADTTTTGTVGIPGSATGNIATDGDQDWFAIELVTGRTYLVDLEGSETDLGTLQDPYLRGIYDADGDLVSGTSNDDIGTSLNSRVTFTPTADGTYYVAVGAYDSNVGTYTVSVRETGSVSEAAGEDLPADTTTTGSIEVDSLATGNIATAGDRDWFAVELVAGQLYAVDLEGSQTSRGTLEDPQLHGIYDADGDLVSGTSNDDIGTSLNSRLTFTPTADGTFYVAVGAYVSNVGTYTLSVRAAVDTAEEIAETTGEDPPTGTGTGDAGTSDGLDWATAELIADPTDVIPLKLTMSDGKKYDEHPQRGYFDADGDFI